MIVVYDTSDLHSERIKSLFKLGSDLNNQVDDMVTNIIGPIRAKDKEWMKVYEPIYSSIKSAAAGSYLQQVANLGLDSILADFITMYTLMPSDRGSIVNPDDITLPIIMTREIGSPRKEQFMVSGLATSIPRFKQVSNLNDLSWDRNHWSVSNGKTRALGCFQMHAILFETILMRQGFSDFTNLAKNYHKFVPFLCFPHQLLLIRARNRKVAQRKDASRARLITSNNLDITSLSHWFAEKLWFGYSSTFRQTNTAYTPIQAWGGKMPISAISSYINANSLNITDLDLASGSYSDKVTDPRPKSDWAKACLVSFLLYAEGVRSQLSFPNANEAVSLISSIIKKQGLNVPGSPMIPSNVSNFDPLFININISKT